MKYKKEKPSSNITTK